MAYTIMIKLRPWIFTIVAALWLGVAGGNVSRADTIVFKDGRTQLGRIIEDRPDKLTIEVEAAGIRTELEVNRSEVREIQKSDRDDAIKSSAPHSGFDPAGRLDPTKLDPRLAAQLHAFAPYVSMEGKVMLGRDVGKVLEELSNFSGSADSAFDAHKDLQRSFRDIRSFLVLTGQGLRQTLEKNPLPTLRFENTADAEFVVSVGLLRMFVEMVKVQALSKWQADFDEKCRTAYRNVLPLFRAVAKGSRTSDRAVVVTPGFTSEQWVYLQAINQTGVVLTNVTLAIRLETIDGRWQDHFYYLSNWPPKWKYPLRLSTDWDAKTSTSARVELISDELLVDPVLCAMDSQVPTAADTILNECELQLKARSRPKGVQERLKSIGSAMKVCPDRADRRTRLMADAVTLLNELKSRVDDRIQTHEKKLAKLHELERQELGRKKPDQGRLDALKRQIKDEKGNLAKAQQERADLLSGKK